MPYLALLVSDLKVFDGLDNVLEFFWINLDSSVDKRRE